MADRPRATGLAPAGEAAYAAAGNRALVAPAVSHPIARRHHDLRI